MKEKCLKTKENVINKISMVWIWIWNLFMSETVFVHFHLCFAVVKIKKKKLSHLWKKIQNSTPNHWISSIFICISLIASLSPLSYFYKALMLIQSWNKIFNNKNISLHYTFLQSYTGIFVQLKHFRSLSSFKKISLF